MIKVLRENWALFAGMLMLMAANGLLVTVLTIRGASLGFSETVIGLMQACYPLGALIGSAVTPKLIERVGHVRSFGALASLCSIASIVHLITTDPWSWGAMRFLAGLCFPGLYVIAESWLNAKAANNMRAITLSIYFVIQTLGASAGQQLAGMKDPSGMFLFGLASILVSLSLVPLLLSHTQAPEYHAPERLSIIRLARISPMSVSGTFLNGIAQAAFYTTVPLYGLALGLGATEAASLLVVGTLAGAALQFPIGWVSDRMDRRVVVGALSVLTTIMGVSVAVGLWGNSPFSVMVIAGASILPVYSLCVAHGNDLIKPSQIVPASGTMVLTLNIGILCGAFLGPFMIGHFGPDGLMGLWAVVGAITAVTAVARRISSNVPEETGIAQPITVQGTQMTGALHPDAEYPDQTTGQ